MKIIQIFKIYYKTILWLMFMSYLLFSPGSALPKTSIFEIPHFDKVIHFAMFAGFTFLWLNDSREFSFFMTFSILFLSIIFAAGSEIIQYYLIAGRTGNIYDFLSDFMGLFTGLTFYLLIWKKLALERKKNK